MKSKPLFADHQARLEVPGVLRDLGVEVQTIHHRIQCFGIAQEICGSDFIEATLLAESKVSDLILLLKETYPKLGELRHFFIARNQAYASPDDVIEAGDELVIIPPVSGG